MSQARMRKDERREQLLWLAAEIVREEGADGLTLKTLADRAGVSKPITYNHFRDRKGLLTELYLGYDERLVQKVRTLDPSLLNTLEARARAFSTAFYECTESNGAIYDAVVAALSSYPEFTDLRTRICRYFVVFYRELFGPVIELDQTTQLGELIAIYGASDELARALTAGLLSRAQAVNTLSTLIVSTLGDTVPRTAG